MPFLPLRIILQRFRVLDAAEMVRYSKFFLWKQLLLESGSLRL